MLSSRTICCSNKIRPMQFSDIIQTHIIHIQIKGETNAYVTVNQNKKKNSITILWTLRALRGCPYHNSNQINHKPSIAPCIDVLLAEFACAPARLDVILLCETRECHGLSECMPLHVCKCALACVCVIHLWFYAESLTVCMLAVDPTRF